MAAALKAAGGGVVREQPRLRKSLVVVQVALSFLMIVAAALFVRSLDNLLQVHPGFSTERVTSFTVDLERSGYKDERSRVFGQELLDRVRALPGVDAAGFATFGILEGGGWGMGFTVEGFTPKPGEGAGSMVNAVSPGYLEALRAPIVRGRAFTTQDARIPPEGDDGWPYRHAIVNETFVKRYFAGRDPIGRHVGFGSDPGTPMPMTIVGVMADSKYQGIREETRPQLLLPAFETRGLNNLTLYVRSRLPTAALVASARGRGAGDGRGHAGVQRRDDGRARGALAAQRAPRRRPVGGVRDAGDAARRHRPLRRDGLHGDAAVARDRHPHGARRPRRARRRPRGARGRPARGRAGWRWRRPRRGG